MKAEITEAQIRAIIEMIGDIEGMLGCSDTDDEGYNWDTEMQRRIKIIDRFLKKNRYTR